MGLFSPRDVQSTGPKLTVVERRSLATNEPVNGVRIVPFRNSREAEAFLSPSIPSMVWRVLTRLEKGEIELFKLVNNVGSAIAAVMTLRGQKLIEGVFPIREGLTTAKALTMASEAITLAGYAFTENLEQTIVDRHGSMWKLGSLPDQLDLHRDWIIQAGGVIDMPKALFSTANVSITTSTIRKRSAVARIKGSLDLSFSNAGTLPGDMEIGGDLIANDAHVMLIEDGASIGGALRANGSKIEWFSSKIFVGSDVDLGNTPLTEFDAGVTISGRLRLDNVQASTLGNGLTVKKDTILTGAALASLPRDSLFEGDVYTHNPDLVIPRSTHILGRLLVQDDVGFRVVPVNDMRRI